MKERVQKIISSAGLASRRTAEEWIAQGRVAVNGVTAVLGTQADPEADDIRLDGRPVCQRREKTYIMLHKPRGYVTTLRDEKGRATVVDLIRGVGTRVYPVGRLDMDSEGLLLLTDDGDMANGLMHPRREVVKVYETTVSGCAMAEALPILRSALIIDGWAIEPAHVDMVTPGERPVLRIAIHEGRNRQVRKMCQAAGLKVHRLRRLSVGPVELGDLPVGQWRYLSENEIDQLEKIISVEKTE